MRLKIKFYTIYYLVGTLVYLRSKQINRLQPHMLHITIRSKCEYDIGFNIVVNSCDVNLKAYNTGCQIEINRYLKNAYFSQSKRLIVTGLKRQPS